MQFLEIGSGKTPCSFGDVKNIKITHLDRSNLDGIDVIHDLNQFPWPFEDNSFEGIIAFHVLEHLEDLNGVLREMYRILKPNGVIIIKVPYFRHWSAFADPTHKIFFTTKSFDYWVKDTFLSKKFGNETTSGVFFKKIFFSIGVNPPILWRFRQFRNFLERSAELLISRSSDLFESFGRFFFFPYELRLVLSKGDADAVVTSLAKKIVKGDL